MSSRRLAALRIATALVVTAVTLELGACVLLSRGPGATAGPTGAGAPLTVGNELTPRLDGIPKALRPYVIHPYIGFVRNRDVPRHSLNNRAIGLPVNEYGFFGPPPAPAREGEFVVAVTGGSVALELFLYGGERLERRIAELPGVAGRRVRLVSLALGGFKQPQQLAGLNYFLSRGHHFDLVLNLDGFNEAVLPFTENRAQKIAPDYPRMWRVYTSRSVGAETAVLYGRIYDVKQRLASTRAFHARAPFRYSAFLRWWGTRSTTRLESRQRELEADLRASLGDRRITPQEEGPPYRYGAGMFDTFAATWSAASIQMGRLCRANGIPYVHFLQPNQYVAGSRSYTDEELRNAVAEPGTPYRTGVEQGYPALLEAAESIRESGISFVDLTPLFADRTETVYRDRCCHLTDQGNAILADAVVDAIAGLDLSRTDQSSSDSRSLASTL